MDRKGRPIHGPGGESPGHVSRTTTPAASTTTTAAAISHFRRALIPAKPSAESPAGWPGGEPGGWPTSPARPHQLNGNHFQQQARHGKTTEKTTMGLASDGSSAKDGAMTAKTVLKNVIAGK